MLEVCFQRLGYHSSPTGLMRYNRLERNKESPQGDTGVANKIRPHLCAITVAPPLWVSETLSVASILISPQAATVRVPRVWEDHACFRGRKRVWPQFYQRQGSRNFEQIYRCQREVGKREIIPALHSPIHTLSSHLIQNHSLRCA
jgi:hypothetical protein